VDSVQGTYSDSHSGKGRGPGVYRGGGGEAGRHCQSLRGSWRELRRRKGTAQGVGRGGGGREGEGEGRERERERERRRGGRGRRRRSTGCCLPHRAHPQLSHRQRAPLRGSRFRPQGRGQRSTQGSNHCCSSSSWGGCRHRAWDHPPSPRAPPAGHAVPGGCCRPLPCGPPSLPRSLTAAAPATLRPLTRRSPGRTLRPRRPRGAPPPRAEPLAVARAPLAPAVAPQRWR